MSPYQAYLNKDTIARFVKEVTKMVVNILSFSIDSLELLMQLFAGIQSLLFSVVYIPRGTQPVLIYHLRCVLCVFPRR